MSFASLSTVIAVFENLIAAGMDSFGWSRGRSSLIWFIVLLLTSVPCALGYNAWSHIRLIGARDILDSEDFIVSNLLLPIGSLVFALFCVTRWGWGFEKFRSEANAGRGLRIPGWMKHYFLWGLSLLILVILIQGLVG